MIYRRIHLHRHQFVADVEMKVYGFDFHKNRDPWDDAPHSAIELYCMLSIIIDNQENIMATLAELETTLGTIDTAVAKVKADVDTLIAKLAAIPVAGLTPEQQAALDAAVAHAQTIAVSVGAIDTTVNPPAA